MYPVFCGIISILQYLNTILIFVENIRNLIINPTAVGEGGLENNRCKLLLHMN
jgi:hypothetical protein